MKPAPDAYERVEVTGACRGPTARVASAWCSDGVPRLLANGFQDEAHEVGVVPDARGEGAIEHRP